MRKPVIPIIRWRWASCRTRGNRSGMLLVYTASNPTSDWAKPTRHTSAASLTTRAAAEEFVMRCTVRRHGRDRHCCASGMFCHYERTSGNVEGWDACRGGPSLNLKQNPSAHDPGPCANLIAQSHSSAATQEPGYHNSSRPKISSSSGVR